MKKKKVIFDLRASTKKQTNKEDDLPVQRAECMEYFEKHNREFDDWEFYTEIIEGGVSAYHKAVEDRAIQQVIELASNNRQDQFVLLAFYSDRISRQDANGFNFIDTLFKLNVEVWTVQEGRLSMDTPQDRLMLFIKFWGNNNESRKTAHRVDGARKRYTELGLWTGGNVQYGYVLQPTGEISKKGRVINDLVREPVESSIVKEMYDLLVYKNYTLNGIMQELNSRGLVTKKGCKWNTSTIKNILKNPLNKGYIAYRKTTQQNETRQKETDPSNWVLAEKKNENYVIVSEEEWQLAQDILARKAKNYKENLYQDGTYKSNLLLAGLLKCGYCGTTISPAVSLQWSGKKKQKKIYCEFYKCNLRAKGAKLCGAKTYISAKKLEKAVLDQVYLYLDSLEKIDCTAEIQKMVTESSTDDKSLLESLTKERLAVKQKITALEDELLKSVMGESALSKENINSALDKQKLGLERVEGDLLRVKQKIEAKEISQKETVFVQQLIPVWREVFEQASLNVKKVLLSLLIEKIVVTNSDVDIYFKISLEQFLKKLSRHKQQESGKTEDGLATTDLEHTILYSDGITNTDKLYSNMKKNIVSYKDWSADLPHHIVAQMLAFVAVGTGDAEVVVILIGKSFGDRRKGF